MENLSQDRDYYFDDRTAPDGWYEYHLQRRGENLELFRDGVTIRQAIDPERVLENRLFEQGVLKVLEYFLVTPQKNLKRTKIEDEVGNLEPYLGRIRKLLNEPPEGRLIQRTGPGELIFAPEVRDTPSAFHATYATDLRLHWKPRAMGCGALFQGGQWYFSGRTAVLRHIVEWLGNSSSEGLARVVTGHPGSGKSAVLGYIVACSDREEIQQPQLKEFLSSMPKGTQPKPGSVDFAFNLRNRTLRETLRALGDCFRCNNPDEVVVILANRVRRTVLVFDGLEEAEEPALIAETVLRPLTGYDHLWLLIGCRHPELSRLGGSVVTLDLDGPEFRDDTDIVAYVERILLAKTETRRSPYRNNEAAARKAAEAVAEAADGNFLVAFIAARSLIEKLDLVDADRSSLPRMPQEEFSDYLRRLAAQTELGYPRLRQALLPLAYSRGEGLPAEVWARFTPEDVWGVLELAAAFVAAYEEDGHTVYRLYHASLAEALHDPKRDAELHRFMAERLISAVPERDWLRADWYTRKYLAHHAHAGGMLDALVLDTKFLAVADPPQLLRVVDGVASDEARRRASWYQLTADRLIRTFDVDGRLSYLQLTARQHGAVDLSESTETGPAKPWSARWARWNPETPHVILRGHIGTVNAVAISGDMIVSAGQDASVRIWDRRTGKLRVPILSGHEGPVRALAVDAGKVFSGGDDRVVRVWDLDSGSLLGRLSIHEAAITAIAVADGIAVSGSEDGTAIIWDITAGEEFRRICVSSRIRALAMFGDIIALGTETGDVVFCHRIDEEFIIFVPYEGKMVNALALDEGTVVIGGCDPAVLIHDRKENEQIEGDFRVNDTGWVLAVAKDGDLIAAGGTDNAIRCWDRRTGMPIANPLRGHEHYVSALAVSGALVASGSWDGTVRLWTPNNIRRISYFPQTSEYPKNPLAVVAVFEDITATATDWGIVRLWNAGTGEPIGKTMNEEACFMPLALAIDRKTIMAAARLIQGLNTQTGESPEGHVSWSDLAQGTDFSVAGFALYRWDRENGSGTVQPLPLDPCPSAMAITRDLILIGYEDGEVHLLPLAKERGAGTVRRAPRMHTSEVLALAIAGQTVVSGSRDGTVRVWNSETGAVLETPLKMTGPYALTALGISKRIIVAGNSDGELRIWDSGSGLVIGTLHLGSHISGIAVDDSAIYAATFGGLVRIDWHRFNSPLGS